MIPWFVALSTSDRRQVTLLLWAMVLYLVHVTFFSSWQIEDAAITFAFARNAAVGEGFVANAGGAWVEGFSNPVWTLVLTVTTFLGLPTFGMAKLLGVGSGLATLPLAWLWAKRLQADDDTGIWPAFAPLTLALSGPFTQWSASGLENGPFNLCLAAGVVLLLREGDEARAPWSAIPLGLLALSRPDAPLYAGMITLLLGPRAFWVGGTRWLAGFLVLSGGPFVVWHAWSYWAFGWELPNTAYAKDPSSRSRPWVWTHRSWTYLRTWAQVSVVGFFYPLFLYAQTGFRGWRGRVGHVAVALALLVTLPGMTSLRLPFPPTTPAVMKGRLAAYALVLLLVLGAGWGRRAASERRVAGVLMLCTFAFCVGSGGDWMRGFRWLSFATVPLAVLAAEGAHEVATQLIAKGRTLWWFNSVARMTPALLVPMWVGGVGQTVDVLGHIDTSPFDVQRRVLYHRAIVDRLHIDHPTHLEIDMGGNLWEAAFEVTDIAGLVDVAIAHNGYHPAFINQYIARERRPLMVHIHGDAWVKKSKIVKTAWFRQGWVDVPGFAHAPTMWHNGTYVRRDAFEWSAWPYDDGRTADFGRLGLRGLHTPADTVAPGGELFVEIGWGADQRPPLFRAVLVLSSGDTLLTRELPPAYDWMRPGLWEPGKVYAGRHSVPLPDDLPEGTYDLGVAVITSGVEPRVLSARTSHHDPVFVKGEVRWEGVVEVQERAAVVRLATESLGRGVLAARGGGCEDAGVHWSVARRHLARDDPWQATARPAMDTELAVCWAGRALDAGPPNRGIDSPPREAARQIERARRLNHHAPAVVAASTALADLWEAEGQAAWDTGDDEGAWRGFRDALMADPARSALRRRLEMLRFERTRKK